MTDFLMSTSRVNNLDSFTSGGTNAAPSNNVFGSSPASSSSCEDAESMCSEQQNKQHASEEVDSDDNLDDYDKLRHNDQHETEEGEMDEDNVSVSSKTYSTCSSSKPGNSNLISSMNGNRRKQHKPIKIKEEEKQLNKTRNEQTDQTKEEDPSVNPAPISALKTEPHISAQIADLLISNKLDQISTATAAKLLQQAQFDISGQKSPKVQAPAMDTFCALCQKVVCNKYFLKTHLLKMHNMQYEDYIAGNYMNAQTNQNSNNATSTGSLSSASSISSSSSSSSTSSVYENGYEQQLLLTQKLLKSNGIGEQIPKSTGNDLKAENLSPSKQLAALAAVLGQNQKSPNKKPAFNEYEEDSDNDVNGQQTEAILSLLNLSKQQNTLPADSSNSELFNHYFNLAMRQQQQQGLDAILLNETLAGTQSGQSTNGTEVFCDICQKQFCNKYYLKKHRQDVHGVDSTPTQAVKKPSLDVDSVVKSLLPNGGLTNGELNSASLTQILMNQLNPLMQIVQNSPSPSISSASASSISSSSSANKIGANTLPNKSDNQDTKQTSAVSITNKVESNNEVTCPHCTKVFYSTEFLTLHVQNKHANQLDKENSTNHIDSKTKISKLLSPGVPVQRPPIEPPLLANQPFCKYCNKSFCNKYFLKTHMNKAHGKTLIIENNRTESEKGEPDMNDPDSTHFASKVVDRVVCDICNKQVCNKYFLRTHKLRVHGAVNAKRSNRKSLQDQYSYLDMQNGVGNYSYAGTEFDYEGYDMKQDEGEIEEEGEMAIKNDRFNESGEVLESENCEEPGEMYQKVAEAVIKEQQRRGSTCSNSSSLSILTTSSTHTSNPVKTALAAANYNGASPSSVSSFSMNSPSSELKKALTHVTTSDAYCGLCKRQFCSKQVLKNHLKTKHGYTDNTSDMPESEPDDNDNTENDNTAYDDSMTNENANQTQNMELNSSASPGSAMDRVKCLMCNKEVCNKYFLRQHLQSRHKISFEEYLETYGVTFQRKNRASNLATHLLKTKATSKHRQSIDTQPHLQRTTNATEPENSAQRKRKFSNASSRSDTESYDTVSSSSNFKKLRQDSTQASDDALFSDQLLKLTNAADEQGYSDLQAFVVEADESDEDFMQFFRPSMIYLPVQTRLNDSISIRVKLRPVGQMKVTHDPHVNSTNNDEDPNLSIGSDGQRMMSSECQES